MRLRCAFLLCIGSVLGAPHASAREGDELRRRVAEALEVGLSREGYRALADEVIGEAQAGGERGKFWGALSLAAELVAAGFGREGVEVPARELRARSLTLLAARDTDSMRWSSLLSERFLPPFGRLPRPSWPEEFEAYDGMLVSLAEQAEGDRVRAELQHARVQARLHIDRRWDWLSDEERAAALALADELTIEFGDRTVPGAAPPDADTIGHRASRQSAELTRLAFGSIAPATRGFDLGGRALDVSEHRGRVVVLDFWTSFCVPCLELVPHARRVLEALEGEPVDYFGVCGDEDRAQGAGTAKRVGMPWRNLWDGPSGTEGPASRAWFVGEMGWPSVFVLDRSGRIRAKLRGAEQVERELEGILRALLAEEVQDPDGLRPPE